MALFDVRYTVFDRLTAKGQSAYRALSDALSMLPFGAEVMAAQVADGGRTVTLEITSTVHRRINAPDRKTAVQQFLYAYGVPGDLDLRHLSIVEVGPASTDDAADPGACCTGLSVGTPPPLIEERPE